MKYSILLLFFHFIVISCHDGNPTLPISEDKLVNILVDIHVAEAAMQEFSTAALKDSVGKVYYKKIFDIHKVTEADFNKSIIMIKKSLPI